MILVISAQKRLYNPSLHLHGENWGGMESETKAEHKFRGEFFINCRWNHEHGVEAGRTMIEPIFRGTKFFQCPNWTNFMSILHLLATQTWWRIWNFDLSSRSLDDPKEGIFDESRGNLKDSCSPKFSLSQNSEIWQSILHYLMAWIW